MDNRNEQGMMPDSDQQKATNPAPGAASSTEENTAGETKEVKDESQSYMDYNGNSEDNAPARSRE